MNIDIEEVKRELNDLADRGVSRIGFINYIQYRYHGQESIPKNIIDYALGLEPQITIIDADRFQEI